MKSELHLFIIWKNALNIKDKIIDDIKTTFTIRNMFIINWSDNNFSNNLSRFYGTSLPDGSFKEEHCGRGEFLLVVVQDENPVYENRETSHGPEIVNTKMFDKKSLYREWSGGGHRIHATNNPYEFNHDITLLMGLNDQDFINKYKPSKKIVSLNNDLVGADSWESIKKIFYVLNNTINYVVLRDFENDLSELHDCNYDADILCSNVIDAAWILNATEVASGNSKLFKVKLKNAECFFDIKYLGDGYYCTAMEKDILALRQFHNFYYIPSNEYWYMSSLYHALVHKFNFESEYNIRLEQVFGRKKHNSSKPKSFFIKKCNDWLQKNKYEIVNYLVNPHNFNSENILLFDEDLYAENLFNINDTLVRLSDENNRLNVSLNDHAIALNSMINSRGWKLLDRFRKIKRIFKKNK